MILEQLAFFISKSVFLAATRTEGIEHCRLDGRDLTIDSTSGVAVCKGRFIGKQTFPKLNDELGYARARLRPVPGDPRLGCFFQH